MMNQMWSVSSLVNYIKRRIDHDENLMQLFVQGEISNLVKHRSGHYYFTLKDDKAKMNCVMFSNYARLLRFNLENGNKVIVQCKLSVYEAGGNVQLYVNGIQLDGIGDLYYQFELLKKKLFSEGYFDESHKKELPEYPMDIAVISAKEAAAMHDVMTTINRRWPIAKVTFYPSLVQGNGASKQLIDVLNNVDQNNHDVILLVRVGGSIEDLWAFNNEDLAKCIYNLHTVFVSGVGHESDTTLVDYVSDARAATPTAAAELITPNIVEVKRQLSNYKNELIQRMNAHIKVTNHQLDKIKSHTYIKNPNSFIENNIMNLDIKRSEFEKYYIKSINIEKEIKNKQDKLIYLQDSFIQKNKYLIENYEQLLNKNINNLYKNLINDHKKHLELLDAYSPLKILLRGYSLSSKDDKYIKSIDEVNINDEMITIVNDGKIVSKIVQKEKKYE